MFNSLVTISFFLVLSMNALFASEKDYGNLTEITLEKGLNEKQPREVVIGLEAELLSQFLANFRQLKIENTSVYSILR